MASRAELVVVAGGQGGLTGGTGGNRLRTPYRGGSEKSAIFFLLLYRVISRSDSTKRALQIRTTSVPQLVHQEVGANMSEPLQDEVFTWNHRRFDISRLRTELQTKTLCPQIIDLPPDFVERYAQLYLVRQEAGRIAVNVEHALFRSPTRLAEPLVLLHMGRNQGLVSMDESGEAHDYVLGDGNHRLLFAGLQGMALRAFLLSESETDRYEIHDPFDFL